jgi:acyl carrier protein
MEIPPKLKEYLDNNRSAYRGSLPPITDPDEPLQIDSLGLIRLIAFLENEFGYRIEDEEMTADNFATLRQLGELLATKTPTGAGPTLGPPLTRFPEPTGAPSQPK